MANRVPARHADRAARRGRRNQQYPYDRRVERSRQGGTGTDLRDGGEQPPVMKVPNTTGSSSAAQVTTPPSHGGETASGDGAGTAASRGKGRSRITRPTGAPSSPVGGRSGSRTPPQCP
ncbi:hypothetical protein SHO565_51430 [Streptomyces sp. HO565]